MTNLLRGIADATPTFRGSIDDVFAMELAKHLNAMDELPAFLTLVPQYPHAVLARAAKRRLRKGLQPGSRFVQYFVELTHAPFDGSGRTPTIVGLKVERLSISSAVIHGSRFSQTQTRTLRYSDKSAAASAAGFVRRMNEDYPEASIAIERCGGDETRRLDVCSAVIATARQIGVPVWEIDTPSLLEAFALPADSTRRSLRDRVRLMYPALQLSDKPEEVDALGIAVHVYCRSLLHAEEGTAS